jgi:hypothetical protein
MLALVIKSLQGEHKDIIGRYPEANLVLEQICDVPSDTVSLAKVYTGCTGERCRMVRGYEQCQVRQDATVQFSAGEEIVQCPV